MNGIYLVLRTTRTSGRTRLRFRVTRGRGVQMFYRSEIMAEISDVLQLDTMGHPRPRVRIYNHELVAAIEREMHLLQKAADLMAEERAPLNSDTLTKYANRLKTLGRGGIMFLDRFSDFVLQLRNDATLSRGTLLAYRSVEALLRRFVSVRGAEDIPLSKVDGEVLAELRNFMRDEWKIAPKFPEVYAGLSSNERIPGKPRTQTTIVSYFRFFTAFFNALEASEEIQRNPMRRLSRERLSSFRRTTYDAPVALTLEELRRVVECAPPEDLSDVRDAFLFNVATGQRISDLQAITADNVATDAAGFDYVHYLPQKTMRRSTVLEEVETPLVYFAHLIGRRCGWKFPAIERRDYADGLRALLKSCGIDRACPHYDEASGAVVYRPLWSFATSKLARKTHVDLLTRVQVNFYASGLHAPGSQAVAHYTRLTREDRYKLLTVAMGEPDYTVEAPE